MADEIISAAVGARPAPNTAADVKVIQRLLASVTPPLTVTVEVTGTADRSTLQAIHEFQSRFMNVPDSRVDPGGRTLWHLNEGFVAKYIQCDARKRRMLDRDLINAQRWVDTANVRLQQMNDDAAGKVENIFHLGSGPLRSMRLPLLRLSYLKLRNALAENFPLQCEARVSVFGAWVEPADPTGTMHFPSNHFDAPEAQRIERLIHERAHTVFQIGHAGMTPGGAVDFGKAQDDDNGFTYDDAIRNAYCYGWLAAALQPTYQSASQGEVITVRRRR